VRADRLVAVLLLMQARGRVTAAEVAEELEISVATARRDLEARPRASRSIHSPGDTAAGS
jgi:predicted DNA-binding transcriptional regulator YafY